MNLFNALETAHNSKFLAFVATKKDKWETITVTATDRETSHALRVKILQKYNNMFLSKPWKKTEDPSSKIISALTTKVENLEAALATTNTSKTNTSTPSDTTSKPILRIPEWRTIKKGGKGG